MHRDFLSWITRFLPELRRRIEFRRLPCRIGDWSRYALHVSWAGDQLDAWSPAAYRRASELVFQCRSHGVRVINPIEQLSNTGKSRGARLMRSAGVCAPKTVQIADVDRFLDVQSGLAFPILLREERGHGRLAVKVDSLAELAAVKLDRFEAPVASEFVDVRSPDGLYRKYRCVMAGDIGVARHMIVNDHWEVRPGRRLTSAALRDEELEYLNAPCPHHEILDRARRALGLDLVGFDYSLDRAGRVVVWEANSFANLNLPKQARSRHIWPAARRSYAALARLYMSRAGMPIPGWIDAYLAGYASRTTVRVASAAAGENTPKTLIAA